MTSSHRPLKILRPPLPSAAASPGFCGRTGRAALKARLGAIPAVLLLLLPAAAAAQSAPGVPGGLRTVEGDRQLTLHWTASTGTVTDYEYRQRTGTSFVGEWQSAAGTDTEHVVTGLSNGTAYTFEVRATNAGENSGASNRAGGTPKPPQAKIYWIVSGANKIRRANLDGTTEEDIVTGLGSPQYIAVDAAGGGIYWTDDGTDRIQRANLDGSGTQNLITNLNWPQGIAVDAAGGRIYWSDIGTDRIQRANLDGSGAQDLVTMELDTASAIALDVAAGEIYWAERTGNKLYRANMADGSSTTEIRSLAWSTQGIALDAVAGKLYYTSGSRNILRVNMDGSGDGETLVMQGSRDAIGIALDVAGDKMYWTNWSANRIRRANLDGTSRTDVVATSLGNTQPGIALLLKPGKPRELTAAAGDGRVTLRWKAPTPDAGGSAASYEYQYKTVLTGYTGWADAGIGTSTVVTGLANGAAYTFRLQALNLLGDGPESSAASVTLLPSPGAPMNLAAAPGDAAVTLSWTASTGTVTGYEVRWKPAAGTYDGWTATDGTGTSHIVTGLTNGTRYEFQLRALNSPSTGPASNTASATPQVPPGAPMNLMAAPGGAQVMLSWTTPTGTVTGYQVQWKPTGGEYEEWTATGSTDTSHIATGLTNGTRYEFQVRALNGMVPGPASGTASATPQVPPGAPTDLTAAPDDAQVMLSWTASTGIVTGYEVRWKPAGGTYDGWTATGGTDASHIITGLTNGTRYEFQVRALNGMVPGPASNTASTTVGMVRLRLRVFLEGPLE